MQGYLYYSNESIENVNVVNDEIFSFDGDEHLKKFINENYPISFSFSNNDLANILCSIIQYIGMNESAIPLESQIILKMINDSMGIKSKWLRAHKNPELEFMHS